MSNLTLTSVVFEWLSGFFSVVPCKNLTLTSVVFELGCLVYYGLGTFYLTLTSVVFEYIKKPMKNRLLFI